MCRNRESNTGPQDDRICFSLALSQLSYCDLLFKVNLCTQHNRYIIYILRTKTLYSTLSLFFFSNSNLFLVSIKARLFHIYQPYTHSGQKSLKITLVQALLSFSMTEFLFVICYRVSMENGDV